MTRPLGACLLGGVPDGTADGAKVKTIKRYLDTHFKKDKFLCTDHLNPTVSFAHYSTAQTAKRIATNSMIPQ